MQRLFVAVLLSEEVRDRLCGLMGGIPGAKWSVRENLHLTLRFIGEVDEGMAADIDAALTRVAFAPFDLTLDGVGVFGAARKPRALWAGTAESPPLTVLQGRVEAAAQRAGLPAESRKFTPHVTLARLTGGGGARLGRFLAQNGLFRAGPFVVSGFSLMRSRLGRENAIYEELRRYGGDDPASLWTDAAENG